MNEYRKADPTTKRCFIFREPNSSLRSPGCLSKKCAVVVTTLQLGLMLDDTCERISNYFRYVGAIQTNYS